MSKHVVVVIVVAFTEILTVNFVENTPAIDGRQVSVKINISRNASKMICQILGHSKKQKVDCKLLHCVS